MPSGEFNYGCVPGDRLCDDNEKPPRRERVAGFWMMKTDVTVAAYEKCAAAGDCSREPQSEDLEMKTCNWKNARANHPVNCINWIEAVQFCEWIGGRLPTAVEWEYAAKSGRDVVYPWGNAPVAAKRANYCDAKCPEALTADQRQKWTDGKFIDLTQNDGGSATSPVGSYPAGATLWGLDSPSSNVAPITGAAGCLTLALRPNVHQHGG
jgi:formylglycine-generating enzyme required for sulfatase activity